MRDPPYQSRIPSLPIEHSFLSESETHVRNHHWTMKITADVWPRTHECRPLYPFTLFAWKPDRMYGRHIAIPSQSYRDHKHPTSLEWSRKANQSSCPSGSSGYTQAVCIVFALFHSTRSRRSCFLSLPIFKASIRRNLNCKSNSSSSRAATARPTLISTL